MAALVYMGNGDTGRNGNMSESSHKHEGNEHECACSSPIYSSVHQTLDEMAFERGIWYSALHGDVVKLKEFLSKGINVDLRDPSGYTALHYASRQGELAACKLLLRSGADPNAETRSGRLTSMHRAANQGHLDVVRLLLKHGAKVDSIDSDGKTPLHKAAENEKTEVCEVLIDVKPEIRSMRDNHSRIAMDLTKDRTLRRILGFENI